MRQRKHVEVLGLSLLALVGVMAVSASAAQANWLLLLELQSVNTLNLIALFSVWELLIPEMENLQIHCEEGEGAISGSLSEENKKLSGSAEIEYTGCTDLNFGELCDVHSAGDPAGTIVVSGNGKAGMTGEEIWVKAESEGGSPFTDIVYSGEFCPLTEIDLEFTGWVLALISEALADTKLKEIHIVEQDLDFGGVDAELHDGNEGIPLGTVHDVDPTKNWALHLVGSL